MMSTSKTQVKMGLRQLNLDQLKRIKDYNGTMSLGKSNYSQDGEFCPLSIGLGLDSYIENPTAENVKKFLLSNEYKLLDTSGLNLENFKEILEETINEINKVDNLIKVVVQFSKLNIGYDFYLVGSASKFYFDYKFGNGIYSDVNFMDIDILCEGMPPVLLDHDLKTNSFGQAKYCKNGLNIDIWQDKISSFIEKSIDYYAKNHIDSGFIYNITKDYFLEVYRI